MSYCQNGTNQMSCHIAQHPDRPTESFCINCNRRFGDTERGSGSLHFLQVVIAALITALLVGFIVSDKEPDSDNAMMPLLGVQQVG